MSQSENPRILITGGSGLLALNLAARLAPGSQVFLGLHRRKISVGFARAVEFNTSDEQACAKQIADLRPDIVIHTAGLTDVDYCETHPDEAQRANVDVAGSLAAICNAADTTFVYISTDHLFDGTATFVDEATPPHPLNMYAKTKAGGETAVLGSHPDALVVRTNFFCWGPSYRQSFSDAIVHALRQRRELVLFDDVYFTPLFARDMADLICQLADTDARGIFNVSGCDRLSKLEFGQKIAHHLKADASLLRPGSINDRPDLVDRPREMSLATTKLAAAIGKQAPSVDDGLVGLFDEEETDFIKEIRQL